MSTKIYDLSQPFGADTPLWPFPGPRQDLIFQRVEYLGRFHKRSVVYTGTLHAGTHMDTPSHVLHPSEGGVMLDKVPLENCYGTGVVVDFRHLKKWHIITSEDLEKATPKIEPRDFIVFNTGWHKLWRVNNYDYYNHYPGLGPDGAEWLVKKKVKGIAGTWGATDSPLWHYPLSQTMPWLDKEYRRETGRDPDVDFPEYQTKNKGGLNKMMDMFRLDGKVAVVMGGAGGIGEIMAQGLAGQGAKVVVASRNMAKLEEVAKKIQSETKSEASAFQVDITEKSSVAQLVKQVMSKFGTVDILVNSQGANLKRAAVDFPVEDWDLMFNVNVKGTMISCSEFGKVMIEKKKGKVINLSSVRGLRATLWGGNEGYCATKGAVDMITRSLASEWAPYNINVNAIAPSLIYTELAAATLQDPERLQKYLANVPLKRVGQPRDLVGACIFLASAASDFITGQILYLDGGLTAVG